MTKFEMYQITNQHHQDLRAQARVERIMNAPHERSSLIVEGLAFSGFITTVCLF